MLRRALMSAQRSALTRRLLAATIILTTLGAADPADACSCIGPNPACQAVWQTPLMIFVGRVIDIVSTDRVIEIETAPGLKTLGIQVGPRRVGIRVEEVFRGTVSDDVEVWTGLGVAIADTDSQIGQHNRSDLCRQR